MRIAFFFLLLTFALGLALVRGGAPERLIAAILALTAAIDFAIVTMVGPARETQDIRILTLDIILSISITVIALHAERIWPMVVAALLIVGAELQVGVWLAPTHEQQVYRIAHGLSAYPILIVLLAGTVRHMMRTRAKPERDWTIFE